MENDATIADFLKRLEKVLPDAEVSTMWGKSNPDVSKTLQGLRNEIQNVRRAAILQFNAASKKGGAL
jgi:hypothetical protein